MGAPPAFVLEIASEKTVKVDVRDKPAKYLAMGVGEYWRFDPSGGELLQPALQGDRRVGDAWRPVAVDFDDGGLLSGHSRALDLTLHAHGHRLRFCDPHTGTWLPDPDEQAPAPRKKSKPAAPPKPAQPPPRREPISRPPPQQPPEARARRAEAELAALHRRLEAP